MVTHHGKDRGSVEVVWLWGDINPGAQPGSNKAASLVKGGLRKELRKRMLNLDGHGSEAESAMALVFSFNSRCIAHGLRRRSYRFAEETSTGFGLTENPQVRSIDFEIGIKTIP